MHVPVIGFAMCGSFCTFGKAFEALESLREQGYEVLPVMSQNAYETDTRFGKAKDHTARLEALCGRNVIHTIVDAEPIGPKRLVDLMAVVPCTGNTLAKIAGAIVDTPVTMAVKSALRVGTPVVICLASNDALASGAQNIGRLLNAKNVYLVPFSQDDPHEKPASLVSDFRLLLPTVRAALNGIQYQPVLL